MRRLHRPSRRQPKRATNSDLAEQILALYTAAGWTVLGLFLARGESDFILSGSAVTEWVNHGTGSNATQATGSAQPTYSATAVNSRPGITLDGADRLATGNLDPAGASAVVLSVLHTDTSDLARYIAEFGQIVGGQTGCALRNNVSVVDVVEFAGYNGASSSARSSSPITMATPAVVTGTWDSALASNEAVIRHAGVDVTDSRPANSNTAGAVASAYPLMIGARYDASQTMTGTMAAVVLAVGSTAIPTSTVAEVEALLAAQWNL